MYNKLLIRINFGLKGFYMELKKKHAHEKIAVCCKGKLRNKNIITWWTDVCGLQSVPEEDGPEFKNYVITN